MARWACSALVAVVMVVSTAAPTWVLAGQVSQGTIASADGSYRTDYYVHDSGVDGPVVFIVGGVHGNEPAGAAAAEQIRHWQPVRGKLIVLPRANPPALAANSRYTPDAESDHKNLNRNFPRKGKDEPPRGIMAETIWPFMQQHDPDWVIDLHEGLDFCIVNPESVGSSVIYFKSDEMDRIALRVLQTVNAEVTDPNRKLIPLSGGPIDSSLACAAGKHLGANALILETTSKDQPLSWRVRQHRLMTHQILSDIGVIEHGPHVLTPEAAVSDDPLLHVAVYDAAGTGGNGVANLRKIISPMSDAAMHVVGPADIRDGVLSQFDVVIFPGGTGSGEAKAIGEDGREKVRQFVREGGAYIGICAGAYLGTSGYTWGLKLINARTVDSKHWRRGSGTVSMELTDAGEQMLGESGTFDVRYVNGPLFGPADLDDLPPYDVLAHFRSAPGSTGADGNSAPPTAAASVMINTPAMIAAPFHAGRVVLISCHPEQSLPWVIERALKWAAK